MKILMITPYFYPALYYGGPVRITYELAERLSRLGHEVIVATTDVFDKSSRYSKKTEQFGGVTVHYFRNISNTLACRFHAFLPIGFYSFLKSGNGYDVIHIHEYYTLLAVAVAKFGKKRGIPVLLSAHGSMPVDEARGNQGRKRIFNFLFSKTILGGVSKAIALNEQEKRSYIAGGMAHGRIEIVPNGIGAGEYAKLPDRMEFRKKYGIGDRERIILFVGRIHKIKGLDLLVKAFQEQVKTDPDVKLVIVGPDDGYLQELRSMTRGLEISGKIIFTGLLSGNEKLAAFSAADLFVLPSRSEGFPVTVLEACASGLPVIISQECHFQDVVTTGAGLEVMLDGNSLRDAIGTLLADAKLRTGMGLNAQRLVRDQYDWNAVVSRVERVYQNAAR